MGVYTFTIIDETSPIDPARLFKAFIIDNHEVFPKVAPHAIKSVDIVEGDSAVVGCIKQLNLANGTYSKSKLDELDVENGTFKYTSFEGNDVGDAIEFVVFEGQVKASGTGSHYKYVGHFHTKGDIVLTEQDIKGRKLGGSKVFQAVNEYLLNNPQVCA